jgi:ankyrin repeat protein
MTEMTPVPCDSGLEAYHHQAEELLAAWKAGDPDATQIVIHKHPKFLSDRASWLPKKMSEAEVRSATFEMADAQLTIARGYDFADWNRLREYVDAVSMKESPVAVFEAAVDAVVEGDATKIAVLLREHPEVVRARSTRVTFFDPPKHRATLLHYVAANGVEAHHQKTPPNVIDIARMLLDAGAEVDAFAGFYGGEHTTMSMLVSSGHPARAGVHVALVETFLDYGASIEGCGTGEWVSPLQSALAFGYTDVAETLVRRGARVDTLAAAAGLGRLDAAVRLLPTASTDDRHRALSLASQQGYAEVVKLLLDAGEDPNRYNPKGNHTHTTPLHQAALGGHDAVVRLLVDQGARLDIKDAIYEATPLGWAEYGGHTAIAAYLRAIAQ